MASRRARDQNVASKSARVFGGFQIQSAQRWFTDPTKEQKILAGRLTQLRCGLDPLARDTLQRFRNSGVIARQTNERYELIDAEFVIRV